MALTSAESGARDSEELIRKWHKRGRALYAITPRFAPTSTPAQLQRLGNDKKAYDLQLRPSLMVQAIHELQDAGVEADVWKIEGIERKEDCAKVVAAALRDAGTADTRTLTQVSGQQPGCPAGQFHTDKRWSLKGMAMVFGMSLEVLRAVKIKLS